MQGAKKINKASHERKRTLFVQVQRTIQMTIVLRLVAVFDVQFSQLEKRLRC